MRSVNLAQDHVQPCCRSLGEIDERACSEEDFEEYEHSDMPDVRLLFLCGITGGSGTALLPGGGRSITDRIGGSWVADPGG